MNEEDTAAQPPIEPGYYRAGNSLEVRAIDFKIDPATGKSPAKGNTKGLIARGISLFNEKDFIKVQAKGIPYKVESVPSGLAIEQRGANPNHFEIVPQHPMTIDEYRTLLEQVVLIKVN